MKTYTAMVALVLVARICGAQQDDKSQTLAGFMVDIPGGSFQMGDVAGGGDADERPVHTVVLRPFRMGRHEVTRGQFQRFVVATGYRTDAERDVQTAGCYIVDIETNRWEYRAGASWRNAGLEQTDDHPVVCVSLNDAHAYIGWLNKQTGAKFRLPTEAEWEYAARAGGAVQYPWGMDVNEGCAFMNGADQTPWPAGIAHKWTDKAECEDGAFGTSPVGRYRPNIWGLYDVTGNVWEWTADCLQESYDGAPADGTARASGDCTRHVIRGGAWCSGPKHLRVSSRNWDVVTGRGVGRGFRLARDPDDSVL
jgi:formylglycine-generating enzyme required for sulfatase activity